MSPTLSSGALVWVDRTHYRTQPPRPGEVVVFRHEGSYYVKRIYRVPGQTVAYVTANGQWVNLARNRHLEQSREYFRRYMSWVAYRINEVPVPAGYVFVLGDNHRESEDSRNFGPVPMSDIVGRVNLPEDTTIAASYEWELPTQRGGTKRRLDVPAPEQRASGDQKLRSVSTARL